MTIPREIYQRHRQTARYLLQIRIEKAWIEKAEAGLVPVEGIVARAFRSTWKTRVGRRVRFEVPVLPPGNPMPLGPALFLPLAALQPGRYLEAYLNGKPPDLELAGWQVLPLDAPTNRPFHSFFQSREEAEATIPPESLYQRLAALWKRPASGRDAE